MKFVLIAVVAAIASCQSDVIIVEAKPSQITLHWKDSSGVPLKSFTTYSGSHGN